MKARKILSEIIASLLTLLFMYAAVSKLTDISIFRIQLSRAPYFGEFAGLLAFSLPIAELVIVGLLFFYKTRGIGLWAAFLSMLTFTVYVALLLLSGKHLPCTCGGLIQKLTWPQHLIFNILFTLISLIGILLYKRQENENEERGDFTDFSVLSN